MARPTFSVLFKSIDTLSSYAVSDTSVLSLFKIASTFKCRISGQLLLMTCVLATGCIQRSRSVSLIVKNYFISTICVSGTSFKKYYLYYHNFKSFKSYSNIKVIVVVIDIIIEVRILFCKLIMMKMTTRKVNLSTSTRLR